ncbi:transcriptional regulator [Duffyella gerundensis]|jgi:DNA-binding winged helix-turn-helix (wHTH) protein|uniref:transcriptional regulator n=1 Tax=Duffyella gerundensis TaxID=1619313 RepID=UPI001AE495FA|nr:transcriptional regulator [Duffyella gerundensis]QTO54772.1 transcriptional regulator [Duffyella gerundensis]
MPTNCIVHDWQLDAASGALVHKDNGEMRRLGEYQFKLLLVLIKHAGQTLTRDELNVLVWERRVIGNNSLPNAIHALRCALEDDGKQQRIIKTIPRKGYTLEPEFCQFNARPPQPVTMTEEQTIAEAPLPIDELMPVNDAPMIDGPVMRPEAVTLAPVTPRWKYAFLAQLAITLLLAGLWWWSPHNAPQIVQEESGVYQQIRLLRLPGADDTNAMPQTHLNKLLGATLHQLDNVLAARKIKMDVWFNASATSLKYTFVLRNACESREMAMNIFHWGTHTERLNNILLSETERKLNEMATCVN